MVHGKNESKSQTCSVALKPSLRINILYLQQIQLQSDPVAQEPRSIRLENVLPFSAMGKINPLVELA